MIPKKHQTQAAIVGHTVLGELGQLRQDLLVGVAVLVESGSRRGRSRRGRRRTMNAHVVRWLAKSTDPRARIIRALERPAGLLVAEDARFFERLVDFPVRFRRDMDRERKGRSKP
jgi:hypothetical protein